MKKIIILFVIGFLNYAFAFDIVGESVDDYDVTKFTEFFFEIGESTELSINDSIHDIENSYVLGYNVKKYYSTRFGS